MKTGNCKEHKKANIKKDTNARVTAETKGSKTKI
jgi:hypothetical protein